MCLVRLAQEAQVALEALPARAVPRKTPFAQGMNKRENNRRMCSNRGYCLLISASFVRGIERKQENEAGKCRKTSKSLMVKISSVLLSAVLFPPQVSRRCQANVPGHA